MTTLYACFYSAMVRTKTGDVMALQDDTTLYKSCKMRVERQPCSLDELFLSWRLNDVRVITYEETAPDPGIYRVYALAAG